MPLSLILTLVAVFISTALLAGTAASFYVARLAKGRQRLQATVPLGILPDLQALSVQGSFGGWESVARILPRGEKDLHRLKIRLLRAGFRHPAAAVFYTLIEYGAPLVAIAVTLVFARGRIGLVFAVFAAIVAFTAPSIVVGQRLAARRKEIENGLPDALDLLVVCIEAGCGVDQAIVKAAEELAITYPTLAEELRILTMEVRAGKSRLDAFKNLAQRTKVDDVRALVAMLIQTDRFGTSIGQALRTHAEMSRTKRRQRAEERAQKIGVKLVFPLVLLFFPAFFIIVLGPTILAFVRTFASN